VHGDDLLYRFFRDLFAEDPEQAGHLAQRLLESTAIWFPLSFYAVHPVLLPWVIRDPKCRGSKAQGIADQWSSPDAEGFLRDDNSLIKSIPRSLSVEGPPGTHLNGARMGTEFVASHIWREVQHEKLASRVPLLNSFIPNLVWLPSQVAKLSDQEGSPLQRTLQAMSYDIYRNADVTPHLAPVVEEAWNLIPVVVEPVNVDTTHLNWFSVTEKAMKLRATRLQTVTDAFQTLAAGDLLQGKVVTTRYTAGIARLSPDVCLTMRTFLARFEEPLASQ
jgi:hypothetical protein